MRYLIDATPCAFQTPSIGEAPLKISSAIN
jgi:hypothetical protein